MQSGQLGGDLLRYSIDEILILGGAVIHERHDRDAWSDRWSLGTRSAATRQPVSACDYETCTGQTNRQRCRTPSIACGPVVAGAFEGGSELARGGEPIDRLLRQRLADRPR